MSAEPRAHLFAWREAIRNSARSSSEKLVAHELSFYGDVDGDGIFPSVDRVAHNTSLSERTVKGALMNLREAKWIAVTERFDSYGRTSSQYTLTIPDDFVPDPYRPKPRKRDQVRAAVAPSDGAAVALSESDGADERGDGADERGDGATGAGRGCNSFTMNTPMTSSQEDIIGTLRACTNVHDEEIVDGEIVSGVLAHAESEEDKPWSYPPFDDNGEDWRTGSCPHCQGQQEVMDENGDWVPCSTCGGFGHLRRKDEWPKRQRGVALGAPRMCRACERSLSECTCVLGAVTA